MSSQKTIPPRTLEYISMVTDPYHDRNLRVSGFPDGNTMMSAIKRFAKQQTVACPFTLAPGQTWSFHIFTTPLHHVTPFFSCDLVGNIASGLTGSITPEYVGPVNIYYQLHNPDGGIASTIFTPLGETGPAIENGRDSLRTVSLAFELHNTTAELYKAGSLTAYRLNSSGTRSDYYRNVDDVSGDLEPFTFTHLTTVPASLGEANQLPNARTWEASKGIYSVTLPSPNNSYSSQLFQNVGISTGRPNTTRHYLVYAKDADRSSVGASWSPASCTGVMSSMFPDAHQTFTLDYRQVVEFAPTAQSPNLPYATTSPECDLLFMKLYKRMMNSIEPGVPVGFNSAGEWFRRILSLAKDQLPNLLHLLPPNYKLAATAALPAVNLLVDKVVDRLSPAKQPVSKPKLTKQKSKTRVKTARRNLLALSAKSQRFSPAHKQ